MTYTKGEAARRQAERAFQELATTLRQGKSEALTTFLDAISRFRNYSLNNIMLIFSQFPDAQDVRGFREWQRHGRRVQKGEKGIVIIAPIIRKTEDTGETEPAGFRAAHVFDVSQTEGQPLPSTDNSTLLKTP